MTDKIIAKDNAHLNELIKQEIKDKGNNCDLNHIDTSHVEKMRHLFFASEFNGNISTWNTSNVTDMTSMFHNSQFNGDISKWNTGKVKTISYLFRDSSFTGEISKWDTSNVMNMHGMFLGALFNGDISKWNIKNVENMQKIFEPLRTNKPWWAIEDNELRKEAIKKYKLMNKLDEKLVPKEINLSKKLKI